MTSSFCVERDYLRGAAHVSSKANTAEGFSSKSDVKGEWSDGELCWRWRCSSASWRWLQHGLVTSLSLSFKIWPLSFLNEAFHILAHERSRVSLLMTRVCVCMCVLWVFCFCGDLCVFNLLLWWDYVWYNPLLHMDTDADGYKATKTLSSSIMSVQMSPSLPFFFIFWSTAS